MTDKLTELSNKITQINNEQLIDLLIRTIDTFNNIIKPHQLENKELVYDILKSLRGSDHKKFKQYIDNQEYEKAEEICRYNHRPLSKIGYQLTKGRACTYWSNGNIKESYYFNSKGQKHGKWTRYYKDNSIISHSIYKNGKYVNDLLENNK